MCLSLAQELLLLAFVSSPTLMPKFSPLSCSRLSLSCDTSLQSRTSSYREEVEI